MKEVIEFYNIYIITNKVNGKQYVGITKNDIQQRFDQHIYESNHNHTNRVLCKAIRKYGKYNFSIKLLESIEDEKLAKETEIFYISKYKTHIEHEECNGYNMTIGGDGVKGFTITEETRAKLSAAFSGENHPFYGKHLSDEHKMNCSMVKLGIKKSQSTRKNMSESKKKPVLQLHKDTLEVISEYPSIKDAQKITNIEHISQVCNGKRKTAGGFVWKFKD